MRGRGVRIFAIVVAVALLAQPVIATDWHWGPTDESIFFFYDTPAPAAMMASAAQKDDPGYEAIMESMCPRNEPPIPVLTSAFVQTRLFHEPLFTIYDDAEPPDGTFAVACLYADIEGGRQGEPVRAVDSGEWDQGASGSLFVFYIAPAALGDGLYLGTTGCITITVLDASVAC